MYVLMNCLLASSSGDADGNCVQYLRHVDQDCTVLAASLKRQSLLAPLWLQVCKFD